MRERSSGLPRKPEKLEVDFDWNSKSWQEVGQLLLDLSVSVSTGWDQRRPSPPPDSDILAHFRYPLPKTPIATERLVTHVEDLISATS
jgi:hypothetical protein